MPSTPSGSWKPPTMSVASSCKDVTRAMTLALAAITI